MGNYAGICKCAFSPCNRPIYLPLYSTTILSNFTQSVQMMMTMMTDHSKQPFHTAK